MATKKGKKGIHAKLAQVIEKHGERSNVVKAIEATILALIGAAMLLTFFVPLADADGWWNPAPSAAYAEESVSSGTEVQP